MSAKTRAGEEDPNKNKLIVSGEDLESGDEEDEIDLNNTPIAIAVTDADGNNVSSSPGGVKVVTLIGEAPESDYDYEEFGSTVSLNSLNSLELDESGLLNLDPEAAAVLAPIAQRRSPRLDPTTVRRHQERNKSLRTNIADKFLNPVILQTSKKFEKLSHNLSNSQAQMQDAVFLSRLATGNLFKVQKELENFLEEDYLKDLKILPSDEDTTTAVDEEDSKNSTSSPPINPSLTSSSLLTSALSGAAHLV